MSKAPGALAVMLLAPLLVAPPARAGEARWSRLVTVTRPGPVAVELDGRSAERAAIDLEVIAPDGRVVPATLGSHERGDRPARVTRVLPNAAGWQVELDAGMTPPRHQGLRFALARETAAQGVLLEGGDDGRSWRELARGDLFRLGAEDALQKFVLSYEPTEVRFLRLSWPLDAGLPELLETAVLPAAERGGEKRSLAAECGAGAGNAGNRVLDCRLELPDLCRDLEFALAPQEAALGFSLWRAEDGSWRTLGGGERRRHGELRLDLERGGAYRLRLESAAAPNFLAAACELRPSRLSFTAAAAGVYRLTYGRLAPPERRACCAANGQAPSTPAPAVLPLGAESEAEPPAWPRAVEPGAPLAGGFDRGWPVETTAARGQLAVLSLPPAAQDGSAGVPAGLRLDAGGAQLPFLAEIAARPERLLATTLRPATVAAGRSRAELQVAAGGRDAELLLFARGPFERSLRFLRREKASPGQAEREIEIAAGAYWSCPASLARGCELQVPLHGGPQRGDPEAAIGVTIEWTDGDNPPLPEIEAELWVRRPLLYFVHPGQPLVLRTGSRSASPRYDFASLGPFLRRAEAVAAELGPELPVAPPAEAPRWLLPLAIGLAAAVLLAVLARLLRQDPA